MVHASLHWTERVSDDLSLWSFTGKIFGTGLLWCSGCLVGPISLGFISRERSDCKDLLHIHVRGFSGVLSQKPNYRMTNTSREELTSSIRSIHWIFQLNTKPWWLMCNICLPTSSHTNSMLFSMIYSKQWIIMVSMSPSLSQSVKIYFALLIGNYLQKEISMKLVNYVYQPPPPPLNTV